MLEPNTRNGSRERSDSGVTGESEWKTEKCAFPISPESQNAWACTSIPPTPVTPFVALSAFPAAIGDLKILSMSPQ